MCRPGAVELNGQLVQHLAGGGVVALPTVAESPGDRAEEDQELQRTGPQLPAEGQRAIDLSANHPLERGKLLVTDQLVFDNSSAVNNSVDASVSVVDTVNQRAKGRHIAHVTGQVLDLCTRLTQARQVVSHLALLQ